MTVIVVANSPANLAIESKRTVLRTATTLVINQGGGGSGGGSARFVFTQAAPALSWIINHSLPTVSHVTFFDAAGYSFQATWREISPTQIQTQTFFAAIAGKAHLN